MNIPEEKRRLDSLINTHFKENSTGIIWRVQAVEHNIYKDVVLKLISPLGRTTELIEDSEDYHKNYKRVD